MVENFLSNNARSQADGDVAYFAGIARSWQVDDYNTRVSPGAFRRTIAEAETDRKARGGMMLWPVFADHKPELAFGWIATAVERDDGLWVTGYLDPVTPECRKAFQAARDGQGNGLSIGYDVIREHREGSVRVIDELALVEISVGSDPVDRNARMSMQEFNDVEHAMMRAIIQEKRSEKMGNVVYIDNSDDDRRFFERQRREAYGEPAVAPYRIEPGKHPGESREAFEKELRAQMREEDDLYLLHGKAREREIELRRKQREEKQRLQNEALEAERQERAAKQAAMSRESFTPAQFSEAQGLELRFVTNWFAQWANSGRVTPLNADELVLSAQDVRTMAKRDFELLATQFQRERNKRAQESR